MPSSAPLADPAPPAAGEGPFDIEFFWDPVCPFAWITSRWVEQVAAQTGYRVDWRFISLRLLNKDKDYATEFPPDYEAGHTAGLRMLRVAAHVRHELGREPLHRLVTAYGHSYWDQAPGSGMRSHLSTTEHASEVLAAAGLPDSYAATLDDTSWDDLLDAETELALSRTGRDVGTPIITFSPPRSSPEEEAGPARSFFGPVISRIPDDADAVRLWDAVTTLAAFPGFAEMKRSLREVPQLTILGGTATATTSATSDEVAEEDWQGGHRRGHLAADRDAPG
jgi:2-hydroxychromene-2-carboxylate isomerase